MGKVSFIELPNLYLKFKLKIEIIELSDIDRSGFCMIKEYISKYKDLWNITWFECWNDSLVSHCIATVWPYPNVRARIPGTGIAVIWEPRLDSRFVAISHVWIRLSWLTRPNHSPIKTQPEPISVRFVRSWRHTCWCCLFVEIIAQLMLCCLFISYHWQSINVSSYFTLSCSYFIEINSQSDWSTSWVSPSRSPNGRYKWRCRWTDKIMFDSSLNKLQQHSRCEW